MVIDLFRIVVSKIYRLKDKILYIADPNLIHDIKWISYFKDKYERIYLVRKHHFESTSQERFKFLEENYGMRCVGSITDFSIFRCWVTIQTIVKIVRIIRTEKPTLLHIMYAEPNALWAIFKPWIKIPMVLTSRGTDVLKTIPNFYSEKGLIKKISAFLYTKAFTNFNCICSTSTAQIQSISRLSGRQNGLHLIRTGVDLQLFIEKENETNVLLGDKKYFFFPRAMRPLYQHELALDAIQFLNDAIKEYTFVFVDKDTKDLNYKKAIETKIEKLRASGFSILWLNTLEQVDLVQMYRFASLVIMTPKSDGTPVSALETMLCKTPLILPKLNYDQEIFGDWLYFFSQMTAESLAHTILKALQEDTMKSKLELAFEKAVQFADREKEMTKLESIYKSCLKK